MSAIARQMSSRFSRENEPVPGRERLRLVEVHETQLLNYVKATRIEVGLLLNFGPTTEVKRRVYDNDRKGSLEWIQNQNS